MKHPIQFREYRKGTYQGETFFGEEAIIETGKSYKGTFLVFGDTKYGMGAVLFRVCRGKLVGRAEKWDWKFRESDRII